MVEQLKYSSRIKDMGLLVKEMKIACEEYEKSRDLGVIISKSISDNIFMVNTERRRKELAYKIVERMASIDERILLYIATAPYNSAAILSLYMVMKTDRLVFEFMHEVYEDKIELMNYRLTDVELNQFLLCKAQQSSLIDKWSMETRSQVKSALRKVIVDAGLLRDLGSAYIIMPPIVDENIKKLIISLGDKKYLQAMGVII